MECPLGGWDNLGQLTKQLRNFFEKSLEQSFSHRLAISFGEGLRAVAAAVADIFKFPFLAVVVRW